MFSSIEETARRGVIRSCYWPLLRMAKDSKLQLGIELSGITLEILAKIDPDWVDELRDLLRAKQVELIGSGYSQLIGPLVPAEVNRINQQLGMKVYQELLGMKPALALVNEQAWSAGLVGHYLDAGYRAVIMEWDNPAVEHPAWPGIWRYYPQRALGNVEGESIIILWNQSLVFQKFQRYVHEELSLREMIRFLGTHTDNVGRCLALYGNDAEIFDYRPGRFQTEKPKGDTNEWERVGELYEAIRQDARFRLIGVEQALDFMDWPEAGHLLRLESPSQPIPVKKQPKYNIMRWAVTGKDDLEINSACWQIHHSLTTSRSVPEWKWKELCYLWSSDFRTHITQNRWKAYLTRLDLLRSKTSSMAVPNREASGITICVKEDLFKIKQQGLFLDVETPYSHLRLNCGRGLAVDSWRDKTLSTLPLIGTLPHGYFDDIHYAADYYTGHFVLEIPAQHKITDLVPVEAHWEISNGMLAISAEIKTPFGTVLKQLRVKEDGKRLDITHHLQWPQCPLGSLRLGHITLHPESFDQSTLFFRTHNGGKQMDNFLLDTSPINHLAPISPLISISHGIGITEGQVELGDHKSCVHVGIDKISAALTGHIVYVPIDSRYLLRLVFSAMEIDDTCLAVDKRTCFDNTTFTISISSGSL